MANIKVIKTLFFKSSHVFQLWGHICRGVATIEATEATASVKVSALA